MHCKGVYHVSTLQLFVVKYLASGKSERVASMLKNAKTSRVRPRKACETQQSYLISYEERRWAIWFIAEVRSYQDLRQQEDR